MLWNLFRPNDVNNMNRRHLIIAVFVVVIILTNVNFCLAANSVPKTVIDSSQSVLRVICQYPDGWQLGTGFIVHNDTDGTFIATNYHVLGDSPDAIYVFDENGNTITATIYIKNQRKDIAILKLSSKINNKALILGLSGVSKGDAIYAVGFPSAADDVSVNLAYSLDDVTITDGIVSSIREGTTMEGANVTMLQVSSAINPGNSGGPLFNSKGEVVGINTYTGATPEVQGIYWAITIQEVVTLMDQKELSANTSSFPILVYTLIVVGLIIVAILISIFKRRISIILLMKSPSSVNSSASTRITCKKCGAIVPAGSNFCNKCGASNHGTQVYKKAMPDFIQLEKIPPQLSVNYCKKCGAKVRQNTNFCNHCGTQLNH